jgi:hypothetical protein
VAKFIHFSAFHTPGAAPSNDRAKSVPVRPALRMPRTIFSSENRVVDLRQPRNPGRLLFPLERKLLDHPPASCSGLLFPAKKEWSN